MALTKVPGTMVSPAQSGSVIQTVQGTSTTAVSTTSTSYVTTGLTASITPLFSTSKILIIITARVSTAASGNTVQLGIVRGASTFIANGYSIYSASAGNLVPTTTIQYLDSPSTTSSTSYTLYFGSTAGSSINIQGNSASDFPAVITIMEIAQ